VRSKNFEIKIKIKNKKKKKVLTGRRMQAKELNILRTESEICQLVTSDSKKNK